MIVLKFSEDVDSAMPAEDELLRLGVATINEIIREMLYCDGCVLNSGETERLVFIHDVHIEEEPIA